MAFNPFLKQLGFADDDRVIIFHADDVGMGQASVAAFEDLIDFGLLSSGSVMVPCPWFPAVADYCRRHPGTDVGVHLTLTSEWDFFRWRPISTTDRSSGLFDDEGYFPRTAEGTQQQADPVAAGHEIEAQVEQALAAGIDVAHIDTHMGTVFHVKFLPAYIQAALQRKLPLMFPRLSQELIEAAEVAPELVTFGRQMIAELEAQGMPIVDYIFQMPLDAPENRIDHVKYVIDGLQPGLTHFIIHPVTDTPEARAMTDSWPARVADYRAFLDKGLRCYVRNSGVQVINYRTLREQIRTQ